MEAFKSYFLITIDGKKAVFAHKTFAATGFEAAEKSKRWIIKIKECEEIRFLRWKVLTPFKCHFFLENQSKIILQ